MKTQMAMDDIIPAPWYVRHGVGLGDHLIDRFQSALGTALQIP